jgi:hypothetical protein
MCDREEENPLSSEKRLLNKKYQLVYLRIFSWFTFRKHESVDLLDLFLFFR